MDVVIKYNSNTKEYNFYEPTTDTLLISGTLGEGFSNLNNFLKTSGKITGNLLDTSDINYHLDSETFRSMVESNINLLKRLQNGQSEFKTSQDKFGGQSAMQVSSKKFGGDNNSGSQFGSSFGMSKFGGKDSKFGKSNKKWYNKK